MIWATCTKFYVLYGYVLTILPFFSELNTREDVSPYLVANKSNYSITENALCKSLPLTYLHAMCKCLS